MGVIRDTFFPTPSFEYMILGAYVTLCFTYMTFAIHSTNKLLKAILKCAPVLFLLAFIFYTITRLQFGPMQGRGDPQDLERIVFGLIFSVLGDFYLVFDSFFMFGIFSFMCTQLIYTALFGGHMLLFYMPANNELFVAAGVGLVSLLVFFYILPKLSRILVLPAALYCLVLSVMLWCAIVTQLQNPILSTLQSAVGAGLFYISDILLSVNRWRNSVPFGSYLIISTYYVAQILIFLSVLNKY